MNKYWHVINIGIQNTLVYRVNFVFRAVFGLIPLMATMFLWQAVYAGKEGGTAIAGYTLGGMLSYYLLVTVVDALTAVTEDDWQIAADIKDGNISQFLLKPIDYLRYRICLFFSARLIYVAAAAIPVGLFIFWHRENFVLPASSATWVLFALSVVMAALLNFFMSFCMAMLAFWVLEISTFVFIVFAFEYIAGGHMFPVDIMPPTLLRVLSLSPFPYQLFFPVTIFLERANGDALWRGLAMQAFWMVAFFCLAKYLWSRGIRKYTAVGG